MGKVIRIIRRCCIGCGHLYCGDLSCPECGEPGEPVDMEKVRAAV